MFKKYQKIRRDIILIPFITWDKFWMLCLELQKFFRNWEWILKNCDGIIVYAALIALGITVSCNNTKCCEFD